VRQYALDHGKDRHPRQRRDADRVRHGLLTDEMVAARSKARGVSEQSYMSGNLLGREVYASEVAEASSIWRMPRRRRPPSSPSTRQHRSRAAVIYSLAPLAGRG